MDTGTPSLVPNLVLLALRTSRTWGRPRLARELHRYCETRGWASPGEPNLGKQIYRLETGRIRQPEPFYVRLLADFFEVSPAELFGPSDSTTASERSSTYRIRSHKFVPLYVGAEAVTKLRQRSPERAADDWLSCRRVDEVEMAGASAHCWPFGVIMFHLVEDLQPASIAEVAVWRRLTYDDDMRKAAAAAEAVGLGVLSDLYVLSAYWVEETPLAGGPQLDSALRLLCVPRVLVSRHETGTPEEKLARASVVEQALLRDGFDHSDINDFGVRAIATGFASWSGVVYAPRALEQCLAEHELVACELSVQATWAYTDYVRQVVEAGKDPDVPHEYGWRYLRGIRSRLTTERPQETSQHRAMREAIVGTSGLLRRLDQAIDTLRDCDRR
ncbi:hypothetical protein [Pseudonocardia sp. N23]|uniref:hypothetical protein n=1 Tax=Pseudonocardia sp. N23 TaxID=1987376 RepID=UPI000BFD0987|nr:hypothetical protein [Pseudonocardia sp. N23]